MVSGNHISMNLYKFIVKDLKSIKSSENIVTDKTNL